MHENRPQLLTLRGAADSGKQDAGGRGQRSLARDIGSILRRRKDSKIARALFSVWLFCWPVAAFAQQPPTSGDVGILNAGASCPGKIEGK